MQARGTGIEIVAYKPGWQEDFAAIAGQLRAQVGAVALRIDHIGSTSVPGLAAKDRIDIQLSVSSEQDFDVVESLLQAIGYEMSAGARCDHFPPWGPFEDSQWEKRFFRPPMQQRPTNLHVRIEGRANQLYALLFRDYLRGHPLVADAYGAAKRRLVEYHAHDSDAYCEIKDPICDIIMLAARSWAEQTGWSPGLSDA